MTEYFVTANSFAAPFFSDESTGFTKGENPEEALLNFVETYNHPCGLFAAVLYASADAYHKNHKPLAKWLCNKEIEKRKITAGMGSYSCRSDHDGHLCVDGKDYKIEDPKGGKLVY